MNSPLNSDLPSRLLSAFSGVLNGLRLYAPSHPACVRLQQNLWDVVALLLQQTPTITLGVIDQTLFIGEHLYADNNAAAHGLATRFDQLRLHGIEIAAAIQPQQLQLFVELFNQGRLNNDNFDALLASHGITAIRAIAVEEDSSAGNAARKTYTEALSVVKNFSQAVLHDQTPHYAPVLATTEKIIDQVIESPYALLALSMIKDYDDYTYAHSVNVSILALTIGRACHLEGDELTTLGTGALLHDLGKLKIAPNIIKKPGRLSAAEYQEIKLHPELGAKIARHMAGVHPQAIDIILGHHLHYDRCGYPSNFAGETATRLIDITTIADTYDAITTLRAYRRPSSPRQAIAIMQKLAGSQLHPGYLKIFTQTLGHFPVGSLVRLVSNEIGLIVDMDTLNLGNNTVRIVKDSHGQPLSEPYDWQLSDSHRHIAGEVDPLLHNIDIARLL